MKNLFYSTAACVVLLFTTSCDSDNSNIDPQLKADYVIPEPQKGENNTFVSNLFRKAVNEDLQNGNANTLVSPLSVSYALGMLVNGAEGETKDEIMNVLGYNDIDNLNEYSKELAGILTSTPDASISFSIANSIWHAQDFTIKDAFIQTNETFYDAEVNEINFRSPDAIDIINKWCSDKTKNKIPKALEELNEETMALLINALYFKSPWYYGFYESSTYKDLFYAEDGSSANVDIMHTSGTYLYKSDSYAEYLEIPFGNYMFDKAYNMIVILPNEDKTVQNVFNYVDYDPSWTSDYSRSELVRLSLPKFKIDFSYKLEKYILPEMGMKIPFTPAANFNGIGQDLFVNGVIHKTTIDVNEYGVEAAAVTIATWVGSDGSTPTYKNFNINRPFLFSICEKTTGAVLFVGKIGEIVE